MEVIILILILVAVTFYLPVAIVIVGMLGSVKQDVKATHTLINSRMTELLTATSEVARAAGVSDERDAQRQREVEDADAAH